MFSIFQKKAVTTINPLLQANLVKLASYPESEAPVIDPSQSMRVRVIKNLAEQFPSVQFKNEAVEFEQGGAFIITGSSVGAPWALINRSPEALDDPNRLEIWTLDATERELVEQWPLDEAAPFAVRDAVVLPGNRLLLQTVIFTSNGYRAAMHVYDIGGRTFKLVAYPETRELNVMPVDAKATLLYFPTEPIRLRAEIYVNRYNHFWLFSERFPDGIELLKLGIDVGNMYKWRVVDSTLYLRTADTRESKSNNRDSAWSLDLSRVVGPIP
jgi:hypothetical protein